MEKPKYTQQEYPEEYNNILLEYNNNILENILKELKNITKEKVN